MVGETEKVMTHQSLCGNVWRTSPRVCDQLAAVQLEVGKQMLEMKPTIGFLGALDVHAGDKMSCALTDTEYV